MFQHDSDFFEAGIWVKIMEPLAAANLLEFFGIYPAARANTAVSFQQPAGDEIWIIDGAILIHAVLGAPISAILGDDWGSAPFAQILPIEILLGSPRDYNAPGIGIGSSDFASRHAAS